MTNNSHDITTTWEASSGAPRLGNQAAIHPTAEVKESQLGRYTEVGARTSFTKSILGDYSYIVNDGEVIDTTIGKFCSIAAHVRINPGNHPMWRASQSHFTYRASKYWADAEDDESIFEWRQSHPVSIGHDVWIGHGVVILPGITIGNGAVIAAGAVVTKDVAPYTIVGNIPAKQLKKRFAPEIAEQLQAIAWWDWDHGKLREALEDFRHLPIEQFISKHS